MILAFDILAFLLLMVVIVQDFRQRQISWVLIPLLFIAFGVKAFSLLGFAEAGFVFLKNLGFLVIQFFALFVFYFLKERKSVSLINSKIGVGDVLFFIAMSLLNFLFYYLIGIVSTLLGYLLVRLFTRKSSPEVPLAGCLSFIMILFILMQYLSNNFDLYNDGFIIGFLTSWKQ
jgi:hypothetical protein